jgi:hypothetical protein
MIERDEIERRFPGVGFPDRILPQVIGGICGRNRGRCERGSPR